LNIPTDLKEKVAIWSMNPEFLISREPAIYGLVTIAHDCSYYDGGVLHRIVKENPTYTDLYSIANELILRSGYNHHVYIEDFRYNETTGYWDLITGS
jgi:hypothetical protein